MSVTFQLPVQLEEHLRQQFADLDLHVKEAALVELFRQGTLTRPELAQALSLGRLETDGLLKRHNVMEDLPTVDEIAGDVATLRRLLDK